jgi:hypothetical protein
MGGVRTMWDVCLRGTGGGACSAQRGDGGEGGIVKQGEQQRAAREKDLRKRE